MGCRLEVIVMISVPPAVCSNSRRNIDPLVVDLTIGCDVLAMLLSTYPVANTPLSLAIKTLEG